MAYLNDTDLFPCEVDSSDLDWKLGKEEESDDEYSIAESEMDEYASDLEDDGAEES